MKSIVLFATILRIILISAIISFTIIANAQSVALNTTGTSADASAMLDVSSTSKGFLAPRMSTVQRTGIPSPANGLMVFDTDTKTYWYYSTVWKEMSNTGGTGNFNVPLDLSQAEAAMPLFKLTNTALAGTGGAMEGITNSTEDYAAAIRGVISSVNSGIYSTAVRGSNNSTHGGGIGIWGSQEGSGWGVYGTTPSGVGVHGYSGSHYGVYANSFSGTGLMATTTSGIAGRFAIANVSNINDVIKASTTGSGSVINASTTGNGNVIDLSTSGTGRGLQAVITNASNNKAAVYASSTGDKGVEAIAQGTAVIGQSTAFTGGVGVLGQSHMQSDDGVGVKGVSYSSNQTSGAVTGINNGNGVAVYAESTGGGTAVYGKTSKQNGAAIYGINNATQGHGVRGAATGTDGVGIYGDGGASNSSSYAGFFRNSNTANTKDVVQIYNQGAGRGLMVDVVNTSNTDDAIEVRNSGTGNFLKLVSGTNEVKTTITKNGSIMTDGNIYTDGAVSVRGNKGIVRNSLSNQMRIEEISLNVPAYVYGHWDSDFGASGQNFNIVFDTPFSSPPAVFKANSSAGALLTGLSFEIYDVTTVGCKVVIVNWGPLDITRSASVYKLIAIGNE
jgi:hypothetical protein